MRMLIRGQATMQINGVDDGSDARHALHGVFGAVFLTEVTRFPRQSYDAIFDIDHDIPVIHERMAAELGFDRGADITVRSHEPSPSLAGSGSTWLRGLNICVD